MNVLDFSKHTERINKLANDMKNRIELCKQTKYPHKIAMEFDIPEFGQPIISILSNYYPSSHIYVRYDHYQLQYCKCKELGREYCTWNLVTEPFWL